ncbi:hypothetical protein GCM10009777_17510 [Microbacterium pumilum]|uniref:Phage holin family protein n=1 Tax=Microbacterium pumilum TaxID=344165 RepID=A0ABN2SC25_9MICO
MFNVVVLLVIGWLTPAKVGWSAIWAGIVLTALTLWIKPLVHRWFQSMAAKSANQRTKLGEKLVQFFLVLAIAVIVWVVTVALSGVSVGGWLWGWILPPVLLVIGWAIYDAIDDRVETHAGALYDRAAGRSAVDGSSNGATLAVPSPGTAAGARELQDGLTDEQRRMLDELGKS